MSHLSYHQIIVERIASLCKAKNISYNKLATMSGLHQSTIDNIMRGISKNPTIMTLHKNAYAFSMTIAEFLNFPAMNDVSFDEPGDVEES